MAAPNIFFIHLRRPGSNDPRIDPFYEFGSFGRTKCHWKNIFHPRHAAELDGARLAFVQGGPDGSRLVFLTPPVNVVVGSSNCEARWAPTEMPFKYSEAPILISNEGRTDFPLIKRLAKAACPSLESGLSSRLRSRSSPLSAGLAKQVISVYERQREEKPFAIASKYYEALPYVKMIDTNRKATFNRLKQVLLGEVKGNDRCARSRKRKPRRRANRCR